VFFYVFATQQDSCESLCRSSAIPFGRNHLRHNMGAMLAAGCAANAKDDLNPSSNSTGGEIMQLGRAAAKQQVADRQGPACEWPFWPIIRSTRRFDDWPLTDLQLPPSNAFFPLRQ
jgi:hypothetical protein